MRPIQLEKKVQHSIMEYLKVAFCLEYKVKRYELLQEALNFNPLKILYVKL
jgi:hypothetical protein